MRLTHLLYFPFRQLAPSSDRGLLRLNPVERTEEHKPSLDILLMSSAEDRALVRFAISRREI